MCVVFNGYVLDFLKFLVLQSLYQNVNSLISNKVTFVAGEHNNLLLCLSIMLVNVSILTDKHNIEFLFSTAVNIVIFKYQYITG